MRFLDTNILLYSISDDPNELAKRNIAGALLEQRDNALSVQVLQEFYVQATRPTRADAIPHNVAVGRLSRRLTSSAVKKLPPRTWLKAAISMA